VGEDRKLELWCPDPEDPVLDPRTDDPVLGSVFIVLCGFRRKGATIWVLLGVHPKLSEVEGSLLVSGFLLNFHVRI
jgi:hypothetical protein